MALPEYDKNILIEASKMAPEQAVEFFKAKGFAITWRWTETLGDANNLVFQVAKSMNMDILQEIRGMVDKAVKDGITFRDFRQQLAPKLQARGWWGQKTVLGPDGLEKVQLGSVRRLKTIYQTNVQSAYNAGRWQRQARGSRRRPYLMLIEAQDAVARITHKSRSGSIARIDSAFWRSPNSWYPPNGFNCRGRCRSLTEEQAQKRGIGLKGSGSPDPGFGGNPGINPFRPIKKEYDQDLWKKGQDMEPIL